MIWSCLIFFDELGAGPQPAGGANPRIFPAKVRLHRVNCLFQKMLDLLYLLSYVFWPTTVFHLIAVKFLLKYLYLSPTLLALSSPGYLQSLWGSWGFFASAELHWHGAEHSKFVGKSWLTDAYAGKGQTDSTLLQGNQAEKSRDWSFTRGLKCYWVSELCLWRSSGCD